MSRGGGRGRERILSSLHAQHEPNMGLDLSNLRMMTRTETKSWWLNQLSHGGAPWVLFFLFLN